MFLVTSHLLLICVNHKAQSLFAVFFGSYRVPSTQGKLEQWE